MLGLVVRSEGNRPLGRTSVGWEDNTKVHHKQDGRMWTGFIWLRIRTRDRLM
jgi:hypothetical protein